MPDTILDLVARLTLEQKVRLLTGADIFSTHAEPAIGLRSITFSDGPSGVRGAVWDERSPSLSLLSATALAATWDLGTVDRYAGAMAEEARRKGVHVVLGPTINLHRSPLGGRHFEAYSEDPTLTGQLAAAFVRAMQSRGVGATVKHYVANDFETDRFTVDVEVDDRTLRELYLAPFEAAVDAGVWAVMSAYNSVNGTTMSESPLLTAPLRREWGFGGLVVSDWTAVRSTVAAANADQDLVMPGPDGPWGDDLVAAVRSGAVAESAVDTKVSRLLLLASCVGALGPEVEHAKVAGDQVGPTGIATAREIAAAGTVLLRNAGELPWPNTGPGSIAVIGEAAIRPRTQGGGSATVVPTEVINPVDGLRTALPEAVIRVHPGVPVHIGIYPLALTEMTDPVTGEPGLHVRFFAADGAELLAEHRRTAELVYLGTAPKDAAVVELTTTYRPSEAWVRLGVSGSGAIRLHADGRVLVDEVLGDPGQPFAPGVSSADFQVHGSVNVVVRQELDAGVRSFGLVMITLGTQADDTDIDSSIGAAAAMAAESDVAVVLVGTTSQTESEGSDRTTLALPGAQDDLVRAVAAANARTVVVVNSGAPVLLPWRDDVAALLLTWFGGQQYGHGLADVLLGKHEPGGRLPTTWPAAESDVPVLSTTPTDGVMQYREGLHIGYRAWLKSTVAPAYWFGHGLGYTTWELSELRVSPPRPDGAVDVTVAVRNTGSRSGKQVVQVYLSRSDTAIDRPVRWLAGFATATADPGESHHSAVMVPARAFAHWDDGWHTEPGTFTVHVGTSVADLPLCAEITIDA